mmetsp:Transcript_84512/g.244071  ORF Transcript_84512/g.244071 Transcript_84512/m.244071 type:complete len:224 (-) Transcript_84512:1854-2525(-)
MPLSMSGLSRNTSSSKPIAAFAISCTTLSTSPASRPFFVSTTALCAAAACPGAPAAAAPMSAETVTPPTCSRASRGLPWIFSMRSWARFFVWKSPMLSAISRLSFAASTALSCAPLRWWISAISMMTAPSKVLSSKALKISSASRAADMASFDRAHINCTWAMVYKHWAIMLFLPLLSDLAMVSASFAGRKAFSMPLPLAAEPSPSWASLAMSSMVVVEQRSK